MLRASKMAHSGQELRLTHCAPCSRSFASGQRSTLVLCNRARSSSLSLPDSAMKAAPAYTKPALLGAREQSPQRSCLAVSVCADDDERAFGEAFALEPRLASATSVARSGELRNDALKPVFGAGPKECGAVTREFLAELKRACFVRTDELPQLCTTFQQGPIPQVSTVEVQQVEGVEDQFVRLPPDGWHQRVEVRGPALILNYNLAIEDG